MVAGSILSSQAAPVAKYLGDQVALAIIQRTSGEDPDRILEMLCLALSTLYRLSPEHDAPSGRIGWQKASCLLSVCTLDPQCTLTGQCAQCRCALPP